MQQLRTWLCITDVFAAFLRFNLRVAYCEGSCEYCWPLHQQNWWSFGACVCKLQRIAALCLSELRRSKFMLQGRSFFVASASCSIVTCSVAPQVGEKAEVEALGFCSFKLKCVTSAVKCISTGTCITYMFSLSWLQYRGAIVCLCRLYAYTSA